MDEQYKTLQETALYYLDKKISVHVKLKSGQWYNGIIISATETRMVLDAEKFGEMLILFERVKEDGIEPREAKREVGE